MQSNTGAASVIGSNLYLCWILHNTPKTGAKYVQRVCAWDLSCNLVLPVARYELAAHCAASFRICTFRMAVGFLFTFWTIGKSIYVIFNDGPKLFIFINAIAVKGQTLLSNWNLPIIIIILKKAEILCILQHFFSVIKEGLTQLLHACRVAKNNFLKWR